MIRQFSLLLSFALCWQLSAADVLSFNRDIRPILSENCYVCHGPDSGHQEGGLRLDRRDSATAAVHSGAIAIVSGKPEQSELIVRILSEDSNVQMPPPDSNKQLTDKQKKLLADWIAQGAEYTGHWAFVAPQRPTAPETQNRNWSRTPVDQFILARLEQEGLTYQPEADRRTLIRRATLDLTGMPPTPTEVAEFIGDSSPDAYERLLDRLFSSIHYGERMAIEWLDFARYADSNGFQSDGSRDIWAWRDWLVNAYNRNLPFDQFTIEQLAGDLLNNPTKDQIIATGFNRNHRLNGEGGRIVEEWFVETVIDRVETTGLTWLGLTFNCCRCHDHKYDPISQKEFYQLFAIFNSVDESGVLSPEGKYGENSPPLLNVSTPEQDIRLGELEAQVATVKHHLQTVEAQVPELVTAWEKEISERLAVQQPTWNGVEPIEARSLGGATFTRLEDGTFLVSGENPAHDDYQLRIPLTVSRLTGLLIEVLPDPSLPNQSLGRGFNGNFVLTNVIASVTCEEAAAPIPVEFTRANADYEQPGWTASSVVDQQPTVGKDQKNRLGWAVDGNDPAKRLQRRIMFLVDHPIEFPAGAILNVTLRHQSQYADHNMGRFRVSVASKAISEITINGDSDISPALRQIFSIAQIDRSVDQQKALEAAYRSQASTPLAVAKQQVEAAEKATLEFRENLPVTMVMKEGMPRDAFILNRGEYDKPLAKIERGLPAALPPLPEGQPMNRLGLARWIVDPSNPLTARVWVNRQWERFFGTGLVKTTENLGSQSEFPSHAKLLDWLACEFQSPTSMPKVGEQSAQPWDMKAFQKLLMMSAVYRQDSVVAANKRDRDPENRLLARSTRFRLPGEVIRDATLSVSGLLVEAMGGPSVRPYMPEAVWDETSRYGNLRNYKRDVGDGLYRRSIYTIWKRTAGPPSMLLFDAPNREVCTVKRSRTNTPLQALALLNEVTYVEAARGLATRMLKEAGASVDERIRFGFQLVTSRQPVENELQVLRKGLDADLMHFTAEPSAAEQLVRVGDSSVASDVKPIELAAYLLTANVLLNLDEFVTRE